MAGKGSGQDSKVDDKPDYDNLRRDLIAVKENQVKLLAERKRLVRHLNLIAPSEPPLTERRGFSASVPPLRVDGSASPISPSEAEDEATPVDMETAARESRPTSAATVAVWRRWAIDFKDIPAAEAEAMSKDDLKAL